LSYRFEVGDRVKVTNSYEIIGGPPPPQYQAKKLTWPDKKMMGLASKDLGSWYVLHFFLVVCVLGVYPLQDEGLV
jgi:hypothetical protein